MRPSEISIALTHAFAEEVKLPIMLWGSPGIGKSALVRAVAADQGRSVRDIRLALLDPTDLRGIPFYNPETNTAEWAIASILPQDRDSTDVLFLDEINAAPPVIQAAAYQLVLDRKIGEYTLPDGVDIIAAGNREGDKAVTFKMPTPLLNRFIHLDFDVKFEDWYDWAINQGINDHVVGFLNFQKPKLNMFDPQSKSRGFPTPRSWEFVSKLMAKTLPEHVLRGMVTGAIGEGTMIEFMTYREVYLKIPSPEEVLDGKVKKLKDGTSLSAQYAMITSLSYELKNRFDDMGKSEKWLKNAATYFDFVHASFSPEFAICGVRDCLKGFKLPMVQAPNWKNFAQDYTRLVMAA